MPSTFAQCRLNFLFKWKSIDALALWDVLLYRVQIVWRGLAVKGWIFDVYPGGQGEVVVWIIGEQGERIRLIDTFHPNIYVSGSQIELEHLITQLYRSWDISSWGFTEKYVKATDQNKSRVLQLTLKDYRKAPLLTMDISRMGDYSRYDVHDADLHTDRAYLFSKDLFPLAFVEINRQGSDLNYTLLDDVKSTDYVVPSLRVLNLDVEIAKSGKIPQFSDPIGQITLTQQETQIILQSKDEAQTILHLVDTVEDLNPDFIVTHGGDSYLFPYLVERAVLNGVLERLILSRDPAPLSNKTASGKTYFSYGRTFYRANAHRLYGRVHVDNSNTFVLSEADFDGLIEVARTCRVPLHTSARNSIGSSMTSLQLYYAIKDNILIPRNKSIPEAFKTAQELLVADRGGFVFEPRVGAHDNVGEVDFSSMYPIIMVNNNISAETVLCKCCPTSPIRIPELNYHICTKRVGIVPKTVKLIVDKRLYYKRMKTESSDPHLKEVYDKRQTALKWILVTCFGYLGFKNAKFGTVDGHIGVCAFGREALLNAAHTAEEDGYKVIHGIVDSLWLKKQNASVEDYRVLCQKISDQTKIPINFEGRYKWIVFLPSRMHPRIGVLNRYYGVMENGKVKVRGIEVRRRDTPKFVFNVQTDMITVLAKANNVEELYKTIPEALNVVRAYREKLLNAEIPIWDLVIRKHLSKKPEDYRQDVSQVIAARQLIKEGDEVHAGGNVEFLFTSAKNKRHNKRVRAKELIQESTNPDTQKYLEILYDSSANLLSFAGYTAKKVSEAINQQSQTRL
jgi:DNA polymerase, archaea type